MAENTLLKYFFSSGADIDPEDRFHLNRRTRMRRLREISDILRKHHFLKGFTPEAFRAMLEDIGYRGFANFDIKYDSRDGSLYAFEINLRQGRSNYYVTASGFNIAEYLVKDYVLCSALAYAEAKEPCFWHYVPRGVVYRYASRSAANEARALVRQGKEASSLWYRYDVCRNPLRALYLFIHGRRYYKKYKIYCPKQD